MIDIYSYWKAVLDQEAEAIQDHFAPGAYINWHNTNEHFTVEEFIRANCEYPGDWTGQVEKVLMSGDTVITVTHVMSRDMALSFHVTSFIRMENEKITAVDEYWGDDGAAPQWRQDMGIGTKIKS